MTLQELRDAYKATVKAMHELNLAEAQYNHCVAVYLAEREAPPRYAVDLHGDGTLKPAELCSKPVP